MHKFSVLIFVVVLISCNSEIRTSQIPGTYVANHKKGIDSVTVREDGTYRHYFETPDGQVFIDSGRWEFELIDDEPVVTFHDFSHYWNGFGFGKKGLWPAMLSRSSGKTRLDLNDDLNYYYEQISK